MSDEHDKNTYTEYKSVVEDCKTVFINKMKDYGSSWRVLRPESLTDQIYIKTKRIRNIQECKTQKIEDDISEEFTGIVNYSVMALIQMRKGIANHPDLSSEEALNLYESEVVTTYRLMKDKNHDYGEAWRDLRVSSMTDLIYQKLLRIRQIEFNKGKTSVSEGIDANYRDIINYAIFSLILMKES